MTKYKYLFIVVISVFSSTTLFSQQSVFYDAKFIYDSCFDKTDGVFIHRESLYDLLSKKYYPSGTNLSEAELKKNPFFEQYVPVAIALSGGVSSFLDKTVSSVGGLDVTKFANAVSDILIERAKQELTVAFFDRFKNFAKDNAEFKILFPKTTDNLNNLLSYSYPQMLPALRNGFFEDLKQITLKLDDVLELPRYRHLLNNFPEVSIAIRSIGLVHKLETKSSTAADLIKEFASFKDWKKPSSAGFKNMGSTIMFASIFSESLRYKDNSRIWVSSEDIETLISDEAFSNIYMGLIFQLVKNADLKFYFDPNSLATTKALTDILAEQKGNILLFQTKVREFINLSDKVMESYEQVAKKKAAREKVPAEDIYNYINVSIEVVEYTFSIVKVFDEKLTADDYLLLAKKSNSLYKDIYSEQYTQAVNDAVDILKTVHDLTKANNQTLEAIAKPPFSLDKKSGLETLLAFIEKVKPYGLFMANMVEAKDDKEVKAALENVILPVGSSSIKKNTTGNIAVQAYLGAFLSSKSKNSSLEGTWTDRFGVTAPIGISWTPGFSSFGKGGSISLFTSLLDIGAIVDYRLRREQDATDPSKPAVIEKEYKIQLGQIFSPGVYLVYGLPWNLPLSIGFGSQYGPGLSKIEVTTNPPATVIVNPFWRWNAFLTVDLPLFNLKNRPKKQ